MIHGMILLGMFAPIFGALCLIFLVCWRIGMPPDAHLDQHCRQRWITGMVVGVVGFMLALWPRSDVRVLSGIFAIWSGIDFVLGARRWIASGKTSSSANSRIPK